MATNVTKTTITIANSTLFNACASETIFPDDPLQNALATTYHQYPQIAPPTPSDSPISSPSPSVSDTPQHLAPPPSVPASDQSWGPHPPPEEPSPNDTSNLKDDQYHLHHRVGDP
eukprot:CAMPEP_0197254540 /NCGR_PEP_ID=MMETSP1429-20130617/69016_1 /TAXON_ID=49237 /ORGANISM="Chaetoceros  sp., Strain UNC1202" /LENGTH=114 /DNA_ID=CAMNT_0042717561 /DNA_START=24 /DNA_END=368 /DNA_ORIENTATION=+